MKQAVEQLSSTGLWAAMFMFLVGSSLTVPLAAGAGHDAWISILLSLVVSFGIIWVYSTLCQLYPGKSLVEIGEKLYGPWVGRLLGLAYAWYGFHLGVLVLRAFTEFILMVALPNTPAIAISGVMMAIVIWVVYMGIEVVCRCSLAIIGFVLFETILSVFLMGKDFEFGNLLPVVDRGWAPIMEGMTQLVGFPFGETVLFAMIIPLINKIEQARKTMLWAFLTAGLLLLLVNVRNTLVMGDLLSRMIYPSYTAYQYISIADFIERVEPITIITWLAGGFIKISVCLYVCAKSLSTVFSSKRHRTYLIPLCILMLTFSRFIYRNNTELIEFATKVWQWYSVPFQIIVPLLMLLTAVVLKRKRRPASKDLAAPEVTIE